MVKIEIAALLAGTLDLTEINLSDIKGFCMENGLEDYDVTSEKSKETLLNEIADLLDPPAGMNVKEYADANGITVKDVQAITGKTHWKNELSASDIDTLKKAQEKAGVTQPETETENVVNETETPAPTFKNAKKTGLPGFLARRQSQIEKAKAATGGDRNVNTVNLKQYEGIPREKLPGRIRRLVEAQEEGK